MTGKERERERTTRERMTRDRMKRERMKRERWQPRGGGKNKKCHLSGNAEVVPEPSKKVVPMYVNPYFYNLLVNVWAIYF